MTIKLKAETVQVILNTLGKLPYVQARPVIELIEMDLRDVKGDETDEKTTKD